MTSKLHRKDNGRATMWFQHDQNHHLRPGQGDHSFRFPARLRPHGSAVPLFAAEIPERLRGCDLVTRFEEGRSSREVS